MTREVACFVFERFRQNEINLITEPFFGYCGMLGWLVFTDLGVSSYVLEGKNGN